MKLIFFGSGDFGLPTLDALKKSSHQILGIVTSPDKPQGRGLKLTKSPVKLWAESHGVPVLAIEKVNSPEGLAALKQVSADVFVVVAFGTIVSEAFLKLPPLGAINVHPSLLPKYRGASPVQEALLRGDDKMGTTTVLMTKELDAGDILMQEEMPLTGNENAEESWKVLSAKSGALLVRTLNLLARSELKPRSQDHKLASKCTKLDAADGAIDWTRDALTLHNRVRAFYMWPGSYTQLDGKRLKVLETRALPNSKTLAVPGTYLGCHAPDGLEIACGKGTLALKRIQMEGRKPLEFTDFLNGYPLKPGVKLG